MSSILRKPSTMKVIHSHLYFTKGEQYKM
uniref:Uncharacterized protein n=1 Tax=Anguilla anguilla TaxID=7936 RepID=A0A0E9UKR0_ANGAN